MVDRGEGRSILPGVGRAPEGTADLVEVVVEAQAGVV